MQNMCKVDGFICGLFSFGNIVGSLYVIVSTSMGAITCIFKKGPIYGVKFWYQLLSEIVNIVLVLGSFFSTNLAYCMAIRTSISL